MHVYFAAPDEPLRSFNPFAGAEIVSEGRMVLGPPSRHPSGIEYRRLPAPLASLPGWVFEALAEREHDEPTDTVTVIVPDFEGPPIPEGERNRGLFRAACSLRARGAGYEQIAAHLHALNAARCTPPLENAEVEKIARSACRYAPGTPARQVSQEVCDFLDRYETLVLAHPWRGGGLTDHDTLLGIAEFARRFGTMIEAGVRVEVASRDAAPVAGCSLRTFHRSVKRVKPGGWLTQDNAERKPHEAGAFVLRVPRAYCHHPTAGGVETGGTGGVNLRVPAMRWGGISKKKGRILRALVWLNGAATVIELAKAIHDSRPWELRRRHIIPMAKAGIVAFDVAHDLVTITGRSEQALTDERALSGEIMAERRDRVLYERQRQA